MDSMIRCLFVVGAIALCACGDDDGDACAPEGTYTPTITPTSTECEGGQREFSETTLPDFTTDGTMCGKATAQRTTTINGCSTEVDLSFEATSEGFGNGSATATSDCNGVTCTVKFDVTFARN